MSSTSKSNPEQSAEPPAKKRPRITSDEHDSLQSDGGDHKVIHPSGGYDGNQSNVSTAKEDHSKGEKVEHPAKADNDVIGNDAAASEGIVREGKKSILLWKDTTINDRSEDSDDCYYEDSDSDDEERMNSHPSDDLR
jgi:hypothetical protein